MNSSRIVELGLLPAASSSRPPARKASAASFRLLRSRWSTWSSSSLESGRWSSFSAEREARQDQAQRVAPGVVAGQHRLLDLAPRARRSASLGTPL